jgi:hypothetical protein
MESPQKTFEILITSRPTDLLMNADEAFGSDYVWQVIKMRADEAQPHPLGPIKGVRVPRAWVVHSGSFENCMAQMEARGHFDFVRNAWESAAEFMIALPPPPTPAAETSIMDRFEGLLATAKALRADFEGSTA